MRIERAEPFGLVSTFVLAVLTAAGPAISSTPTAASRATPLGDPRPAFEEPRQQWYGIYAEEDKLGYLRNTIRFEPADGGRFVVENEMHLKVVSMGQRREVRSVETLTFDGVPPHRLHSGHGIIDQGPYRQEVTLSPDGDDYRASITAAGSERSLAVPDPGFTLGDVLAPEIWFRERREAGEELAARSFSLSDLRSGVDTYSVRGRKSTVVDGIAVSYYEVGLHSSLAGSIGTALFDADGVLVSGVIGGAFELRLESATEAADFDYAADVYLLGLVDIDRALGEARAVERLVLEVEGGDPAKIPTSAHQSIFRSDSGAWRLTTGADSGVPQAASPREIEAALEETIEYPIREAAVRYLALDAVGDAVEPRQRVEALVSFVDEYLADSYSAEPLTVLDMLDTRKGDCTEHAMLFTTLARSLGIPAREVTGLVYLGDDVRAFGGHAWNEVVLDGHWHPVDATWGEVDINATHILFGPRDGAEASAETLFAGYRLRLLEIERR